MPLCLARYHRSPFFVLDEVDAALDNTNVARVARYVESISSPSFQFIVISLKNAVSTRPLHRGVNMG